MSSMEKEEIMYSTEEEDQSPEEKRQKLEKDDDFHIPHYDRETYYKKLYDFSVVGFDVPDFLSEVNFCGLIIPLPVNEDTLEYLIPYSVAAIYTFNQKYGTNYKVVRVEKAMYQGACGLKYYITFLSKIDDDNSDTTKTDDDNNR
ncbi:hypothetical protein PTKIN_Ptkin19aG0072200 [Pterospermum kingtungense]